MSEGCRFARCLLGAIIKRGTKRKFRNMSQSAIGPFVMKVQEHLRDLSEAGSDRPFRLSG